MLVAITLSANYRPFDSHFFES